MKKILIAGGSGFIGSELKNHFLQSGYTVFILTRNPKKENDIYWDPKNKKIETSFLSEIDVLINLCGANIAKKKWSAKRKKTLIDSRVERPKPSAKLIFKQKSEILYKIFICSNSSLSVEKTMLF